MRMKLENNRILKKENIGSLFIVICIVTIIAIMFSNGIDGNDFWWHIKVGEWICENGKVPTTDIFSWYGTDMGIAWTAHEWLSEVVLYIVFDIAGTMGIYLFSLFSAIIMLILVWSQVKNYIKNNVLVGGIYLVMFAFITNLFFYGRPHVFSYFFLFFELKILYDFIEDPNDKKIYILPVIACLWSNFHGGSSNMAYLLCIVFLLVGVLNLKFGRVYSERLPKEAIIKLAVVTLCTVIAIFINPIGARVFVFPYTSLSDNLMMTMISEWAAPDAKMIRDLIFCFFPIVMMNLGFFTENKKVRLIDLLVMAVFIFLFFRSVRFILLWYIAASFYALRYMHVCKSKEIEINKKSEKIIVFICAIILLFLLGISIYQTVKVAEDGNMIEEVVSDDMINVVKQEAPQKLFNDYDAGETLIYNNIPVFFDSRADMYLADNIFADGVSLTFLKQANMQAKTDYVDVNALIEKYGFDAVLINKSRPLYTYMVSHPEQFESIYENIEYGFFRIV